MHLYNDFDKQAVAWITELIQRGEIPEGVVDGRSITDITAADLVGFRQCHFFAGIAGWPLAFKLAGVPQSFPAWSGSPPCQPYSIANPNAKGNADARNLAPAFKRLVGECRPPVVFGEQVKKAIEWGWLDDLFVYLEGQGYACAAAVLPACVVGTYHQRDRILFGAVRLADAESVGAIWAQCRGAGGANGEASPDRSHVDVVRGSGGAGGSLSYGTLADRYGSGWEGRIPGGQDPKRQVVNRRTGCGGTASDACSPDVIWENPDWLGCKDGKYRAVEPGTFPLADGIPEGVVRSSIISLDEHPQAAKAMRIKGYGNAIVPQLGAAFITQFLESVYDTYHQ